ncbi:IS200/IS605 family element transposase accessory protein TnpB [Paenibacillus mesophilus]|uniref:RNA-guided endonuclease TnpB family protein n=1 Tax=Paenibacillus mesophilus TaxID=2582849 RepID=UPI00110F0156|nr:RNA-guided endonuclease TnpB family protein [Paenibacillus mesophilus]TMV48339.1 IS200/IS605 family element transposase accessory protein TnpB [Paenibacillus mesophilus]
MQTVTVQIRIYPSRPELLRKHGAVYVATVNSLTKQAEALGSFPRLTSKNVEAELPSAIRNQVIRDARSIHTKTIDQRVQRLTVSARITEREQRLLSSGKLGLLKVVEKSGKWFVQISVNIPVEKTPVVGTMGVDLGLKVPAVVATSTGKTRFIGNGRQNKYVRRKYQSRRRRLGKLKKLSAIRKQNNKEHRYIKDQNHKISRSIVNMAIEESVSVIKVEKLSNIRQTTRTSRKNAKHLHNWSFYQLQMFIAYKAALAGIRVIEVNPAYTSQTCPKCEKRNHAKDRMYRCTCGFHAHRDRVGAINIMRQPVADGVALSFLRKPLGNSLPA